MNEDEDETLGVLGEMVVKERDVTPEEHLWFTVLSVALADLTIPEIPDILRGDRRRGSDKEGVEENALDQSLALFFGHGSWKKHFHFICEVAGVCPQRIKGLARYAIGMEPTPAHYFYALVSSRAMSAELASAMLGRMGEECVRL